MSFILDAIKKSEDERQRSKQPDLHSLQSEANYYRTKKNSVSRYMMFLLALFILGLAAWLLWPQLIKQIQSSDIGSELAQPSEQSAVENVGSPIIPKVKPSVKMNQQVHYYNVDDVLPPRHQIQDLWQLPADYQASISEFEFSFHFYSTNSSKRSVVINGRTIREGQMLTSNIKLRVITSTGVILHSNGRFFHINIVEKW